jgi:MoaA/NifB/PqqE/SkfB family radical SAM enzyme
MERTSVAKMKPLLLHYYLTNRCNSKCTFCTIWQETQKSDAKEEDVLKNLRDARKAGCSFVDFTGGEPLLHRNLPAFLREAKKLGFITSVTTNCILFPKRVNELSGLIDLLHFSIDSDNPEQHNSLRGVECYSEVIKSIELAIQNKLTPDLLFTYTDENINNIEGIYKIARKNRLVLLLDPVFNPWSPDKVSIQTHQKAVTFSKQFGVYLNRSHIYLRTSGGNHIRNPLCKAVDTTLVILPDNSLAVPCYHHRKSCIPISTDICDIISSESFKEYRTNQGKYSFCEGCHINCYFDPTYTYLRNKMTYFSLRAKLKYAWTKYFVYQHPFPVLKLFK